MGGGIGGGGIGRTTVHVDFRFTTTRLTFDI